MSEVGKALNDALDIPEDWEITTYRLTHKSGMCFWVGNGASCFDGYDGTTKCLGYFERRKLYKKFIEMAGRKIALKLRGGA